MNIILNQDPIMLVIECVVGIVVLVGLFLFIKYKKGEDSKAQAFLDEMINDIKNALLDEALDCAKTLRDKRYESVEEFENYVLDNASGRIWLLVSNKLDQAVSEGILPEAVRKLVTREYLNKFIATAVRRFNISSDIRGIYCDNVVTSFYDESVEKDKELSDQFNNKEDYFDEEEEVDNTDLSDEQYSDDTEANIKLVRGNEVAQVEEKEIIPPQDDLDITQDETVTEDIDGLTPEEVAAGIHFNKAGRKVDAKGRFVKLK